MVLIKVIVLVLIPHIVYGRSNEVQKYLKYRNSLILSDVQNDSVGRDIKLTQKETEANQRLMKYKHAEYDYGLRHPHGFLAAQHFFKSRKRIEHSAVFRILRKMPKGASLHSHDMALLSSELLFNFTYLPHLYVCGRNGRAKLRFFNATPSTTTDHCRWTLISDVRNRNETDFNQFLRSQLTIIVPDPDRTYPDIDAVWIRFAQAFGTVSGLVGYRLVFEKYFYLALKELYEDNVRYLEYRTLLPDVYELNGTTYTQLQVAEIYQNVVRQFCTDYPEFIGAKLIFSPLRTIKPSAAGDYLKQAVQIQEKLPDFIAGFDLVGQEDKGAPLVDFIAQLLAYRQKVRYFFHAGETNWNGAPSDENLYDAILLNSSRIGHGYAIVKHPWVLREVRKRNIAIEISPISNQVLKLVEDPRNHPANFLLANNYPVVVCSDDPGMWGARALSYDFYILFMGMTNRAADLRMLKQLALNSIHYNALDEEMKERMEDNFHRDWDEFIRGYTSW